nr:hypothetical protein [Tanacetum cinerariifolium]
YQQAVELVSIEDAIVALGRPFNDHNFSQYPLDAPFPDVGDLGANSQKGGSDRIKQQAREQKLTLRQVALDFSRPRREFVGTPEQRGLQRSDYDGSTLREHFGLTFPVNRYTAARQTAARTDPDTLTENTRAQYLQHARMREAKNWPDPLYRQVALDAVRNGALINALRVEPDLGSPSRGGLPATIARRTAEGWRI